MSAKNFLHVLSSVKVKNSVKSLSSKFKAAVEGVQLTKVAFEEINDATDSKDQAAWIKLEKTAVEYRGEHLKIYDVQLEKSGY